MDSKEMAQKRWAKVGKKKRKEHMTKMAKARWDKVRASASIDKPTETTPN